ncbi:uncharacterized protein K452DRAFT_163406 [Aplosporella prunicola CBS 121167]|uniref:Uncharacterized protein n=1 Tax=Aplosporella prunicola CBS 121167 TaxID=1176127 RepID=A0A6A6BLY8_9PEZI|nr:uncharacterized protein K452DRAFT_163406 [Aplosporella prunicola CBS 121167]KAF2143857.1 hypothetical protein K452DRAFT_163406 [Aplosporella prunicola CBS 121167]
MYCSSRHSVKVANKLKPAKAAEHSTLFFQYSHRLPQVSVSPTNDKSKRKHNPNKVKKEMAMDRQYGGQRGRMQKTGKSKDEKNKSNKKKILNKKRIIPRIKKNPHGAEAKTTHTRVKNRSPQQPNQSQAPQSNQTSSTHPRLPATFSLPVLHPTHLPTHAHPPPLPTRPDPTRRTLHPAPPCPVLNLPGASPPPPPPRASATKTAGTAETKKP